MAESYNLKSFEDFLKNSVEDKFNRLLAHHQRFDVSLDDVHSEIKEVREEIKKIGESVYAEKIERIESVNKIEKDLQKQFLGMAGITIVTLFKILWDYIKLPR